MRKWHLWTSVITAVLAMVLVMSCGGGGGGGTAGPQPPTYNLAGTWSVTETTGNNTCNDPTGVSSSYVASVSHAAGSNSMTMTNGAKSYTATVSGTKITYSGSVTSPNCTSLTQTWDFTASSASHIGGTVNYTCQYTGGSCTGTDSLAATKVGYIVGGTVTGLSGSGLVLTNNGADDKTIAANGVFTFATTLANAASYNVAVKTQPTGQTCTVTNGSGTVSSANVTNVAVSCVNGGGNTMMNTIGGAVTNLSGSGLVLTNNGVDDKSISASGSFTFATALASGVTYSVTVKTQPTNQACTVTNGSGTVSGANVTNVAVACGDKEPNNTSITAQTITLPATIKGTCSGSQDGDWYKFTASTSGTVTITLSNFVGDLDLWLYSGASQIGSSTTSSSTEIIVSPTLTAGATYYIYIASWTGSTNYTLTVQ